ncbi:O-antigen ligase family protein [Humitalea sp. 24SJ18S-53]|uniref:O-antigen ligase family protein n=1 Tax=Humitalea sp. 24SJ18S-53 TaxID=3422307 RepID=UPI003D66B8A7
MNAGRAEAPRLRGVLGFAMALAAGAICVPIAVIIGQLESRYMIAVLAALAGLVGLALLGSLERVRMALVAALALGLSLGLSISFLHHTELPGRYATFVGGALAVTVALAQLAAAGYLACWLLESRLVGRRRPVRLVPLVFWPQLLFMAAGVLSLANAMYPALMWLEMLRLAGLLMISVVVMNLTRREMIVYLWVLALSVLLQAGLAGVQFVTGRELGLGVFGEAKLLNYRIAAVQVARPTGTIGDANMLSYFFEITFPVMLAMFYLARHELARLVAALATLGAAAGMVAAYSRAAWMTVPVSVTFVTLRILGRRVVSLRTAIVLVVLTMALAVAMIWLWPLIERRIFGDDDGSVAHRWPLAQAALSIFGQFPALGVGLNNFAVSFTTYDATGYSRVFPGGDHVVHNLHLLILTETGLVGFCAHIMVFAGAGWLAFTTNGDRTAQGLAVAAFAGLLAHLGHGMVDPGFKLSLTISQLVAAQLGLIGCLWLHARDVGGGRDVMPVGARDDG